MVHSEQMTTAAVVAAVTTGWADFAAAVTAVPAADRDTPGPFGWSIKDVVANVMGWERELVAVLTGEAPHAAMGLDADTYALGETDVINAVMFARYRPATFAEVWAEAATTHAALAEIISLLSWEAMSGPLIDEQAQPANEDRVSVLDWIAAGTYAHYLDHARDLVVIADHARLARV